MLLSRATRREKLKQLKEARKAGTSLIGYEEDYDDAVYDEVDEDTFREHKRNQILNDDFIVDDNGEGYVDNGVDEWEEQNFYSDEEVAVDHSRKRKKKPTKIAKASNIGNFFKPIGFGDKVVGQDDIKHANFDDILEDFNDAIPRKKMRASKKGAPNVEAEREKVRSKGNSFNFSTFTKKGKNRNTSLHQDKVADTIHQSNDAIEDFSSPLPHKSLSAKMDEKLSEKENDDPTISLKDQKDKDLVGSLEKKKIVESDDSEEEVITVRRPRALAVRKPISETFSAIKAGKVPSSPSDRGFSQISYTEKLEQSKVVDNSENRSIKMFWIDFCEVNDSILLFGKVQTQDGNFVSGVVQVNGICRELYFLPRKYALKNGEEVTLKELTPLDVHEEIIPLLLEQYGLEHIKAKPSRMKYSFEVPGIPKEADYLKVLLPFQCPKNKHMIMPSDIEGETFRSVFGSNTALFESLVLQRNLMGPCWIEIQDPDFSSIQNTSHCQVEVSIASPSNLIPRPDLKLCPPNLTATSISIQSVLDTRRNKQEVVSVSIATYRNIPQDTPISSDIEPDDIVTLVRPIGSVSLPPGLQQIALKQQIKLRTFPHEKAMLSCLAALIKNLDPDVFIGHRLENISLDVLVHRMYDLKVPTWSALGRRNRKAWPERMGRTSKGFNNNLQIREVFQGRLLCDIANELGQSLTPKCQSWDLAEMYDVVCHKKQTSLDIDFYNKKYAEDANFLLMALKMNASCAKIAAEIAFVVQILSLSKQLTNLAGNAWSHTLSGTRAGRNEFILLHEFQRNSYIVPDKDVRSQRTMSHKQHAQIEMKEEEDAATVTSNKKPKYQGGLVFEPEKGLHKNYILVMDFNSLYPSIIQEYNICFTTVEREKYNISHDEDKDLPDIPDKDSMPGVLPKLLSNLVSRRREVKKLLKDPKSSAVEKAQYDIKQQALKLTANSMYGCLGYVNSRFYAKPLAMLVTNKGREILMDTRQLAESLGLRVVYGDTDSVMIDTNVNNYEEAIKIGEEFKTHVNMRYKLLEIDIDNVFKRLLLHAKKKYAALISSIDKNTHKEVEVLEVKGLDMRRREYCQLSKDISTFVLNQVLSEADPEVALAEIYKYLEEMTSKIMNNEIPIDRFKINTRLSKDPENYPNGKNMPPVQVALRLRKDGKVIKAGSVITYIITSLVNDSDKSSPAERARSLQEVLSKTSNLKPDAKFYLEKQIFAPVERLIERIDGVDMMRVADALGIDTRKYVLKLQHTNVSNDITPLESNIPDSERFRGVSYFVMTCKCGSCFRFGGIQASRDYKVTYNGVTCSRCDYVFSLLKITAELEYTIRKHISLYYQGWLTCDDSACGITTRQISVYGKRCLGAAGKAQGCKGIMRYRYSDRALYNQLLYFDSIFNVDRAKKGLLKPINDVAAGNSETPRLPPGQIEALAEQNRERFAICANVVQKYLSDCGRRYVDMGQIFDFMNTLS